MQKSDNDGETSNEKNAAVTASEEIHKQPQNRYQSYPVKFTGKGSEYFSIWVVNILLTLLTLGIYYPWARVRHIRYFYNNTFIDNENFDYHAKPKKMLPAYILLVILWVAYAIASNSTAIVNLITTCCLVILIPLLTRAAFRFRRYNTSWRGLHFSFLGSVKGAYLAYAPFFIPLLVASLVFLFAGEGLQAPSLNEENTLNKNSASPFFVIMPVASFIGVVFVCLQPWFFWRTKRYQYDNYMYADLVSQFNVPVRAYYLIVLKTIGFISLVAVFLAVFFSAAYFLIGSFENNLQNAWEYLNSDRPLTDYFLIVYFIMLVYAVFMILLIILKLFIIPYLICKFQNLNWNNTSAKGLKISSDLKFSKMFWLSLKNGFLNFITFGLYSPFAKINMAKLRLEAVTVHSKVPFDQWIATYQAMSDRSAVGEMSEGLFDLDIGL